MHVVFNFYLSRKVLKTPHKIFNHARHQAAMAEWLESLRREKAVDLDKLGATGVGRRYRPARLAAFVPQGCHDARDHEK